MTTNRRVAQNQTLSGSILGDDAMVDGPRGLKGLRPRIRSLCRAGVVAAGLLAIRCAPLAWAGDSQAAAQNSIGKAAVIEHFETRVRPLLLSRCVGCHGGKKPKGGVRLDDASVVRNPNVLVAGKPEQSPLIQVVEQAGEIKMPPKGKLSAVEISDLKAWVLAGAVWPEADREKPRRSSGDEKPPHWSFQPVKAPAPPTVRDGGWVRTPIDRFILAKLESKGMKPVSDADRGTLLRRVHFDLIGLPPTPAEQADFLMDRAPDAFAKVVDRLLASARYGERWGRHWMDVVRYADTAGDNADYPIPEARLYRDYIIDSFNADKPYDEFIREQVAGDLLGRDAPSDKKYERTIATGYLALSRRYATAPYEFWHLTLEDTIDTLGQSILGLTLRCARCHDHKFDPISMHDYYALYGIFDSTRYPWAGGEEFQSKSTSRMHFVALAPAGEVASKTRTHEERKRQLKAELDRLDKLNPLQKEITDLDAQIKAVDHRKSEAEKQKTDTSSLTAERKKLDQRRKVAKKELQAKLKSERDELRLRERFGMPPDLPVAYAVTEGTLKNANIQQRGNPGANGPEVIRGDLRRLALGQSLNVPKNESGRRQLADWLTRRDHPLTARVMVNRIWQHHFGTGLVATPSNFGTRGASPTHPELLDYLADEFVKGGWSMKRLHRLILASRTWQLASTGDAKNATIDPGNELHWRFNRRRLDAEALRDATLAVGGQLDLARPGGHPFPSMLQWNWTQHNQFKAVYPTQHRSVYLMTQRLQRHPYLALFDGPDTNTTTGVRTVATVPLQSLYLLNGSETAEHAAAFARRLFAAEHNDVARIRLAYSLAYARPVRDDEIARMRGFLNRFAARRQELHEPGSSCDLAAWTSLCRVLLTANEFFYVD